jgi:hypothetical protein
MPGFPKILALLALSFFAPHVAALDANSHVSVEEQAQINAWLATNRHQVPIRIRARDVPSYDDSRLKAAEQIRRCQGHCVHGR